MYAFFRSIKSFSFYAKYIYNPEKVNDASYSEGRDVFPCDFRAKIDFFALNDCLCVIIMKNDGV